VLTRFFLCSSSDAHSLRHHVHRKARRGACRFRTVRRRQNNGAERGGRHRGREPRTRVSVWRHPGRREGEGRRLPPHDVAPASGERARFTWGLREQLFSANIVSLDLNLRRVVDSLFCERRVCGLFLLLLFVDGCRFWTEAAVQLELDNKKARVSPLKKLGAHRHMT
jgi:hypothetical protein